MRRLRIVLLAGILALTSMAWAVVPASAERATPLPVYYLALGDSLSVGWQPFPDEPRLPDGSVPARPTDDGYPNQLVGQLKGSPQLVRMGCPGETSVTMRNGGGPCAKFYASGNQLTDAKNFIESHRGQIAYLTIDIGANDVVNCVGLAGVDATCFTKGLDNVQTSLDEILRTLRQSINDSDNKRVTRAAGMTYYNPSLALWFSSPALANATVGYQTLLNATETAKYLRHGFRVAPVAYAFQTYDFRTSSNPPLPVNVDRICVLTWACKVGDIHANVKGYELIADTFAKTLRW